MDWTLAITRNRDALKPIIAALCAMAGLTLPRRGDVSRAKPVTERSELPRVVYPAMLPRHIIAAILLVLRPAESAVRRLIVILATLTAAARRPSTLPIIRSFGPPEGQRQFPAITITSNNSSCPPNIPAFALFDPLKSFDPDTIWNLDEAENAGFHSGEDAAFDPASGWRIISDANEPFPAHSILRRLAAIRRALETLPHQARRLLRYYARRDALLTKPLRSPVRFSPMRPGLPPGWRQRSIHEVDPILKECHGLANDLLCDTG